MGGRKEGGRREGGGNVDAPEQGHSKGNGSAFLCRPSCTFVDAVCYHGMCSNAGSSPSHLCPHYASPHYVSSRLILSYVVQLIATAGACDMTRYWRPRPNAAIPSSAWIRFTASKSPL